jgi:osmotically-inducible protein OsmY
MNDRESQHAVKDELAGVPRSNLSNMRGSSQMALNPHATPTDIKLIIDSALEHNAKLNALGIEVKVLGNKVILCGTVSTWVDRDEVKRVAWAAPGGCVLEDNIQVISKH